jgi:hypothetical protein
MRRWLSWNRAPVCDAGGRRFNSFTSRHITRARGVSSVDLRVPGFDPGGRRFESCTPHQSITASSHSGLVALPRKQIGRATGTEVRILHSPPHNASTTGKSSNGRTADSDSANVGSTPAFPANSSMVALAQAARAPGCELGGCGFEPRTSPHVDRAAITHPRSPCRWRSSILKYHETRTVLAWARDDRRAGRPA